MSWRWRKRIKIAPGLALNLSKSGVSMSAGVPGATVNVGRRGLRGTAGLPGTGISVSKQIPWQHRSAAAQTSRVRQYLQQAQSLIPLLRDQTKSLADQVEITAQVLELGELAMAEVRASNGVGFDLPKMEEGFVLIQNSYRELCEQYEAQQAAQASQEATERRKEAYPLEPELERYVPSEADLAKIFRQEIVAPEPKPTVRHDERAPINPTRESKQLVRILIAIPIAIAVALGAIVICATHPPASQAPKPVQSTPVIAPVATPERSEAPGKVDIADPATSAVPAPTVEVRKALPVERAGRHKKHGQ
jgi:hypothetical protein